MADLALCWVAVVDLTDERVVTVSLTTDYLSSAVEGEMLVAKPELIRRPGSLAFYRCEIRAFGPGPDRHAGRVVANSTAVLKPMRRTPRSALCARQRLSAGAAAAPLQGQRHAPTLPPPPRPARTEGDTPG